MSAPDQERSICGGDGGGIGSGGGGEDEDGVISQSKKDGLKEEGAQRTETKSRRVSVFRFGKVKNTVQLLPSRCRRRRRRKRKNGGSVNSECFGRWGNRVLGLCLCGKQSPTLDSSGESPSSDPNSKEFANDMLKVFIENNDFYAVECNTHLDSN